MMIAAIALAGLAHPQMAEWRGQGRLQPFINCQDLAFGGLEGFVLLCCDGILKACLFKPSR